MSLVFGLIVGGVQVVAAACQASLHDGQILIGKCQIDDQFGLIVAEQSLELFHIISINLCCFDVHLVSCLMDGIYYLIAFLFSSAGNHEVGEYVCVLGNLESGNGGNASCTNH